MKTLIQVNIEPRVGMVVEAKEERKGKHSPFFFIFDIFKKLKLYLNIVEQGFLFLEQEQWQKI